MSLHHRNTQMSQPYWMDGGRTVNIHFTGTPWFPSVESAEVVFKEGAVVGESGKPLLNNVIRKDFEPFEARIENVATDVNGRPESFDIRFTKEISEATRTNVDPENLFYEIGSYYMDIHSGVLLADVDVAWVSADTMHVTLPPDMSVDWNTLYVDFWSDVIWAEDNSVLYDTYLEYMKMPDAGEVEVSTIYEEVYVPFGTTVVELLAALSDAHPAAVIQNTSSEPDDTEIVTNTMTVDLDGPGSGAAYPIRIQGVASTLNEIHYWQEYTDVDVIKIDADITGQGGNLFIKRGIALKAADPANPVTVEITYLTFYEEPSDLYLYPDVTLVGIVYDNAQILEFMNYGIAQIRLPLSFEGYGGDYVYDPNSGNSFYAGSEGRALVYDVDSLLDALADTSIAKIYVSDSIDFPAGFELDIPFRIKELASYGGDDVKIEANVINVVLADMLELHNVLLEEQLVGVPVSAAIVPPTFVASVEQIHVDFDRSIVTAGIANTMSVIKSVYFDYAGGVSIPVDVPLANQTWNNQQLELSWVSPMSMTDLEQIRVSFLPDLIKRSSGEGLASLEVTANMVKMDPVVQNVIYDTSNENIISFDIGFNTDNGPIDVPMSEWTTVMGDVALNRIDVKRVNESVISLETEFYDAVWDVDRKVMTVTFTDPLPVFDLEHFNALLKWDRVITEDGKRLGDMGAYFSL